MKAHIGVDVTMHSVIGTAANVADATLVDQLLHGEESYVCADAGLYCVAKRSEHAGRQVIWSVAARRSSYRHLQKGSPLGRGDPLDRKGQGPDAGQGRTSVPRDQMPVRLHQGAFTWVGEERGRAGYAVCAVEPLVGTETAADGRRGAAVMRAAATGCALEGARIE